MTDFIVKHEGDTFALYDPLEDGEPIAVIGDGIHTTQTYLEWMARELGFDLAFEGDPRE